MKKLLTGFTAILAAMILTSCATLSKADDSEKVEMTAENSTIVILDCLNNNWYNVLQANLETDYGFCTWKQSRITTFHLSEVIDPVLVGSKLKIFSHTYTYTVGNVINTVTTNYGLAGYDINVTKPGILYVNTTNVKNPEKYELKALKKIQLKYKKTVYNEAIQKRISELKNVNEGDDDE